MVCALDPDPCVGAQGGEGPSALEVPGARLERIVSRQAVEGRPARCQFARSELEPGSFTKWQSPYWSLTGKRIKSASRAEVQGAWLFY